jgi:hypothetical protein
MKIVGIIQPAWGLPACREDDDGSLRLSGIALGALSGQQATV